MVVYIRNVPHRLRYLNTWSLCGIPITENLVWLEKIYHWGQDRSMVAQVHMVLERPLRVLHQNEQAAGRQSATGPSLSTWNLKSHPKWSNSYNKATPTPTRALLHRATSYESMGAIFIQNITKVFIINIHYIFKILKLALRFALCTENNRNWVRANMQAGARLQEVKFYCHSCETEKPVAR